METDILAMGITPQSLNWPKRAKNWFFAHGGRLDLETGKLVHGPKLERATQRFSYALQAKAIGAFRPNREKDELTYAIGTAEHSGRTRGLGRNISWEHGFPNDRDTYRSRQRRKDEEAARISRLEEYVRESREALLQAQEREKDMQARMQDEIIKQVQIAMSAQRQASDPGININISPLIS